MGKMFTSVAIAQLVSQGKLSWDDTLAKVLPSYPNRDAAKRITIRQLLTHTAGVPDPFLSPRYGHGKEYATHEAMLPDFADAPLTANAGKSFDYSNGNFAVLAAIVERLSGLSYEDYLKRNVWGPAGMTLPSEKAAVGYARFTEFDPLGIEARRPRPCVAAVTRRHTRSASAAARIRRRTCTASRARCAPASSCRRRSLTASSRARSSWAAR